VAAAIGAGSLCTFIVFLIGFVMGSIRVLLLAPRLGEMAAVVLLMLTASWFVSRWCVDRLDVPHTVPARSVMGAVGFAVLMLAEFGLSVLVFGRSTTEHLASSHTLREQTKRVSRSKY